LYSTACGVVEGDGDGDGTSAEGGAEDAAGGAVPPGAVVDGEGDDGDEAAADAAGGAEGPDGMADRPGEAAPFPAQPDIRTSASEAESMGRRFFGSIMDSGSPLPEVTY
jgi:hypothetical protein